MSRIWKWLKDKTARSRKSRKTESERITLQKIQLMYENFRQILALNDSTLQLISDIEDRLSGRMTFSLNLIINRINRAVMEVFMMVKSLDQIAPGRYVELYDTLRRVKNSVELKIPSASENVGGAFIVPLSEIKAQDAPLVGNKMANLGEVKNVVGLNVPDGFAISTSAFNRFINQGELRAKAEKLEELFETAGPRVAAEACREVQQAIIGAPIPPEVEKEIWAAYDRIAGGKEFLAALRSSGVGEDRAASHAGVYYTELNVGRGWLLESYRWVLASAFGIPAVQYRLKCGLTSEDAQMAVGCLKMINARCNGVLFSRNFDDLSKDCAVISVSPGIFGFSPSSGKKSEELIIIRGEQTSNRSQIISADEIETLFRISRQLEEHFGGPQDIEWVIDDKGKVFILQCRPMRGLSPVVDREPLKIENDQKPLLAGGSTACPGIGVGPVYRAVNEGDLARFPDDAVLVAHHSSPAFAQVMNRCSAIVTDAGSPIGHMGILAREFGIPCIVGLTGASDILKNGLEVTVDAASRRVFAGRLLKDTPSRGPLNPMEASPAVLKLKKIAVSITPLNLIDPASSDFAPTHCQTLHDITRFVHEKVFEVMFYLGDRAVLSRPNSLKLKGNLPYDILVLDVGGGIDHSADLTDELDPKNITSFPMKSFLAGLLDSRIIWNKPRAVSAKGFLSVVGEGVAGPPAEAQGVGRISFAIISDRYMNFSAKAGYHFNTVDTYCGDSLNKNYIHFRFEGGAANETRRERRCQFLRNVLEALNFKVQCRGDTLVGRLEKYDRDYIHERLVEMGRLIMCARQLDMLMDSDMSPQIFARAFLDGKMENFS
jgi:pyruvate,water dikinase